MVKRLQDPTGGWGHRGKAFPYPGLLSQGSFLWPFLRPLMGKMAVYSQWGVGAASEELSTCW